MEDAFGNPLDGDGDGTIAGDFTRDFVMFPSILVDSDSTPLTPTRWSKSDGGNDHYYGFVMPAYPSGNVTWHQARDAAVLLQPALNGAHRAGRGAVPFLVRLLGLLDVLGLGLGHALQLGDLAGCSV